MSEQDSIATYFASPEFADALASAIERRVSHALTPLDARVSKLEADLLGLTSHVRTCAPFAKAPAKAPAKGKAAKSGKAVKAETPAANVAEIALPAQIQALAGSGYDAPKWAQVRDAMREAGLAKSDANRAAAAFLRSGSAASAPASERPAASVAPAAPKAPAEPKAPTERSESFNAWLESQVEFQAQARCDRARKTPNPRGSIKAWITDARERSASEGKPNANTLAQYERVAVRALEILSA